MSAHELDPRVRLVLTRWPVVAARDEPSLRSALSRGVARGHLARVLPGVYAAAPAAGLWQTRVAAVNAADPDAVIGGDAAWAMSGHRVDVTSVLVHRAHHHRPVAGFEWRRGAVPADLIRTRGGLRWTCDALTALDRTITLGGDALDEALRAGVPLAELHGALARTGDRPGNALRRVLLHDSRDEPWSAAERLGHRLLRSSGIRGWRSNVPLMVGRHRLVVDVLFGTARLVLEFDGYAFHGSREMFEADRLRDARLRAVGFTVLRFTWRALSERPEEVVALTRAALRQAR
ncbi:MAG: endonuclease domain-containing protein [Propionibacteriales bacterium]|nr:endonuclease domain-containing protein [Propionibacteriales bacterium]